jgi:AraC-like DNA-binding protein
MAIRLLSCRPAPALARVVDHYWLCLHNRDRAHMVLPDGCIDLVLEFGGSYWRGVAHGSTTRATALPCVPGRHYLGIRLRPAQGRHLLRASASELTDRSEDARHLLPGNTLERLAEGPGLREADPATMFTSVDHWLLTLLAPTLGEPTNTSELMVRHIEVARGNLRIDTLARRLDRSPRQLQRLFLEQVGMPAKLFACITRLQHARTLIATAAGTGLADIAALAGYADQSHMTRDFARLAGCSPAELSSHVAFVQDPLLRAVTH